MHLINKLKMNGSRVALLVIFLNCLHFAENMKLHVCYLNVYIATLINYS